MGALLDPRAAEATDWRRRTAGDRAARARLVERHLPLARRLARRYVRTSEPLEDLEQVACVGLVHAVDRFDPARGIAFSSFAVPTILGELRRHFRDRTWAVRVPRDVRDAAHAVDRATAELVVVLGRTPSAAEVGAATGLGVEQVLEAREAVMVYRCDSLDRPLHPGDEDGGASVGDRIGAPDDRLNHVEDRILLDQLSAAALAPRDREVLRLRFREDMLQREIAARVGLSQMHVSRILRDGVRRLAEQAA